MKKSQMKMIVIIAGVIVAFLLIRFLDLQHPIGRYFSGLYLSYIVIAVFSLIFNPYVGSAVGFLSRLCTIATTGMEFNLVDIPFYIFELLLTFLYGFVIGKLLEKRTIKADSKEAVFNIGLFSLLSAGLFIVAQQADRFLSFIYVQLSSVYRIPHNYKIINPERMKEWLIASLIIGGISFAIVFFFYKCIKINIPFFPIDEPQEEILPETQTESKFDGSLLSYIGWIILGFFVTVLTLGICFPFALCMVYGWRINHTIINGRRLRFVGSAISLFGHWLLWILLCVVTLGIYIFWLSIALEKWKVKNTTFAE